MSHVNLLCSLRALIKRLGKLDINHDMYVGYLPLAHVLELTSELCYLVNGIPIGKLTKYSCHINNIINK